MDDEVFCVDCKAFVKLNSFSKDHKRHEMKLMAELLEDRRKECYNFLELRKQKNNVQMSCFEESDKKWQAIQAQAASMKTNLIDHSKQITAQVEMNRLLGCKAIDAELSKNEQKYIGFKNKFINSENEKLLNLENIIENLDEMSLRKFSLILPDLPKTTLDYNAELKVTFQEASVPVIDSKHLPKIISRTVFLPVCGAAVISSQPTVQPKFNKVRESRPKLATPVLAVAPTCSGRAASSSNSNKKNKKQQESIQFSESSYNLGHDKFPYMVTQDHIYLYVLYRRMNKLKVFCKNTKRFHKQVNFNFEPCGILSIDEKLYIIDFKQQKLFISWKDEKGKEKVCELDLIALPTFLSFGRGKKVIITSDKNVQSYDPSNGSLSIVQRTSNIGRVLRCFDLGSMSFIVVHNKGSNKLLYMKDGKAINEYNLNLDVLKNEYLIDVNKSGNVCIVNAVEKLITVLDCEFKTLGYVHVQQIETQQIKDIAFDNKNIIYITSVQPDNVCKLLRIPFQS